MKTLVVAPHADDELLGCGGTLLRRVAEGGKLGWLLVTSMAQNRGWSKNKIRSRAHEIQQVRKSLGVNPKHFYPLNLATAELETLSMRELVEAISEVFASFQPEEVLLPHPGDAHSDHQVVFQAACACTKRFRYPSIRRVLVYETLSETDFGIDPRHLPFSPNLFVNIEKFLDKKCRLLRIYKSEIGAFPFPRSPDAIRSLAKLRGAASGFRAAEAFALLRQYD
jgi:LmbE family N-acetylglucosaminyl deacetylase